MKIRKTRNAIVRTGLAAAASAGLLLAGPALAEDPAGGSAMEGTPTQAAQQIESEVRQKLQQEEGMSRVEVESEGDKIKLKGEVMESSQRDEAEELARSVPGVSDVENEIEVAGPGGGSGGMDY